MGVFRSAFTTFRQTFGGPVQPQPDVLLPLLRAHRHAAAAGLAADRAIRGSPHDRRVLGPAIARPVPGAHRPPLSSGIAEWTGRTNRPAGLNTGGARIDQAIGAKMSLFGAI